MSRTAILNCLAAVIVLAAASSRAAMQQPGVLQTTTSQSSSHATDQASSYATDQAQTLFDFDDSDIKFDLRTLMNILRDHNHEGWVLAAYPDPKTSRPLIGAGFSLDVEATEHVQSDPLNPHTFIEPSSAQLWQAAGLDSERLQHILGRFHCDLDAWSKKKFRRKTRKRTLRPELTDEEATRLLRISAIQAVHNAQAYCRDFDKLTASQQLGLSQLVFQMGVNLEEFVQFLTAINGDDWYERISPFDGHVETDAEHWSTVQGTLIDSLWARSFTSRATSVIAMFDPYYAEEPGAAERRVEGILSPPALRSGKTAPIQKEANSRRGKHGGKPPRTKQRSSRHR